MFEIEESLQIRWEPLRRISSQNGSRPNLRISMLSVRVSAVPLLVVSSAGQARPSEALLTRRGGKISGRSSDSLRDRQAEAR